MDEPALIQASCAGDESAFGCLVDLYYKGVYRLAYQYTGSHADSDDICQETFLRAFTNIRKLKDVRKFRHWLFTIAVNLARTLSKKKKFSITNSHNIRDISDGLHADKVKGPFDTLSSREKTDIIHAQLQEMPEHIRLVTILVLMEGLNQKEAAAILDCSESSVSRHFEHGKNWLRNKLRNLI